LGHLKLALEQQKGGADVEIRVSKCKVRVADDDDAAEKSLGDDSHLRAIIRLRKSLQLYYRGFVQSNL